jgi:hypothetical protein
VVRDILRIPQLKYEDYPFLQWISTQVGYVDDSDEGNCAHAFITSNLSFNYDIKYLIFTIYFLNSETVGAEEVATNVHHHSYLTNSFNKQSSNSDGSEMSQDEQYVFDDDDDDDSDLGTGDENDEIEYDNGEEEWEDDENENEDEDEDGEEDEEEDSDENGEEDDDEDEDEEGDCIYEDDEGDCIYEDDEGDCIYVDDDDDDDEV